MMAITSKAQLDEYIRADLFRYSGKTDKKTLRKYRRRSGGFRFTFYMRKCSYYRHRKLLKYIAFPYYKIKKNRTGQKNGFDIYEGTSIGKGLHIAHFGCLVIHADAVLGENVSLSHGVTVGQTIKDGKVLTPVIGNNVYIAPGAKVIGGIKIGNNAAVGANAVVTRDVPENAVVAGVPARVLSHKGAGDYIINPYAG